MSSDHLPRKKLTGIFYPLLIFALALSPVPIFGQADFFMSIDLAQFRNEQGGAFLEIYYSLPEASVVYTGTPQEGYVSRIFMSMKIFKDDSLWATKAWKIQNERADTSEITRLDQLVDLLRYPISDSASYKVDLFARDGNQPEHVDSVTIETNFRRFSRQRLEISDIELASKITRITNKSLDKFTRGRYSVIPNPGQLYGTGSTTLFYYYEIYNMNKYVPGDVYILHYSILDANGKEIGVLHLPSRRKKKRYDSSIELGRIDLSLLPTGIYSLVCRVGTPSNETLASRKKRFYVYNPEVEPLAGVQTREVPIKTELTFLEGMSERDLDDEFDKMRYLVKREHQKFYKNSKGVQAKKQYLYSLWLNLRPDKLMTPDGYRRSYLERIDLANQQFSNPMKPGWETDEGRVFILYGPPTDIERHESEINMKPYRIWHYENLEGGVYFVFVDRLGFNRFELIHSTKRGELYEPNWQEIIKIMR